MQLILRARLVRVSSLATPSRLIVGVMAGCWLLVRLLLTLAAWAVEVAGVVLAWLLLCCCLDAVVSVVEGGFDSVAWSLKCRGF